MITVELDTPKIEKVDNKLSEENYRGISIRVVGDPSKLPPLVYTNRGYDFDRAVVTALLHMHELKFQETPLLASLSSELMRPAPNIFYPPGEVRDHIFKHYALPGALQPRTETATDSQ